MRSGAHPQHHVPKSQKRQHASVHNHWLANIEYASIKINTDCVQGSPDQDRDHDIANGKQSAPSAGLRQRFFLRTVFGNHHANHSRSYARQSVESPRSHARQSVESPRSHARQSVDDKIGERSQYKLIHRLATVATKLAGGLGILGKQFFQLADERIEMF